MKIYWLNDFEKGSIGMMPKPNGLNILQEIKYLKKENVDTVVCLLEYSEIIEFNLEQEEYFCKKEKINFIYFPIKDYSLPNKNEYLDLINKIDTRLKNQEKIVIHCKMGIGRTSTVAAGVLIKNNIHSDDIFEYLSEKREEQVPDTKDQVDWVKNLIPELLCH